MRIARLVLTIVCSVLCVLFTVLPVAADRRVALVIGNSAYKKVSKLPNPVNDAELVSKLLKSTGFDVVESRENLSVAEMRRAVRDFSDMARSADVAVVFYAGHGIEMNGINHLIPVDAVLERDIDVEDETVSLERILSILEPVKQLRLVILDACRDNPFLRTMRRTIGTRSIGRGLAKVEPVTSDTLIAFAAKAGSVAEDGSGSNSPFTTALINNIATPGLDLRIAFGRVRDDVLKATHHRQEPFVYGSLGGSTVALVPGQSPSGSTASAPDLGADIRRDYELAKEVGTKIAWEAFLARHSTGMYAQLAREQLTKINADEAKRTKPPPTPKPSAPAQTGKCFIFKGQQYCE